MEILRDRREEFDRVGVKPLGVSRDSPWTHISWMQALDLNFGLLSDWNAEAVRGFGVSQDFRGLKDVAARSAFLVCADISAALQGATHLGAEAKKELLSFLLSPNYLNWRETQLK